MQAVVLFVAFVAVSADISVLTPREEILMRSIASSVQRTALLQEKADEMASAIGSLKTFGFNLGGAFSDDVLATSLGEYVSAADDLCDDLEDELLRWRNITAEANTKHAQAKAHAARINQYANEANNLRTSVDAIESRITASAVDITNIADKMIVEIGNRDEELEERIDVTEEAIDVVVDRIDTHLCKPTTVTLNVTSGTASETIDLGSMFDNIDMSEDYSAIPFCSIIGLSTEISEQEATYSYGHPLDIEKGGFEVNCYGIQDGAGGDETPIKVEVTDRSMSEKGLVKTVLVTVAIRACTNPGAGWFNYE